MPSSSPTEGVRPVPDELLTPTTVAESRRGGRKNTRPAGGGR